MSLEKVIHLRQLLCEFHRHPFLKGRLVLKGGTAINLFYLERYSENAGEGKGYGVSWKGLLDS
jgi:predicted nucleotidyltransferase component of viral defense system